MDDTREQYRAAADATNRQTERRLSIRVEPELYNAIIAAADAQHRSASNYVRAVLLEKLGEAEGG